MNNYHDYISCKILLPKQNKFNNGVIFKIKEKKQQVYIFLSPNDLAQDFNSQDEVVLKFTQDHSEFIYKGVIIKKLNNFFRKGIIFKIKDIKEYQNCRLQKRFNVKLKISAQLDEKTSIPANVVDMSLGGLQFYSETDLEENTDLTFKIKLSKNNAIEFIGKIMHKSFEKHITKYGVKIININDENNQKLTSYIDLLTKEHEQLVKQLRYFRIARLAGLVIGIIIIFVIMTVEL